MHILGVPAQPVKIAQASLNEKTRFFLQSGKVNPASQRQATKDISYVRWALCSDLLGCNDKKVHS